MKGSLERVLLVAITVFPATVSAASESPWDEPVDVAFRARCDGTTQRYVLLVPRAFDATQPVDVIVALHGHGSDRWQFIRQDRPECGALRDAAARYGMIVVAPDYRAKTSWMGPDAEADVLQILDEIQEKYHVRHTFVCGGSMGASAALTFAVLHPDRVDAVVALNGTANHVEYTGFQDAISESFGGSKEEVPDEYRRRSAELRPERLTMPMSATVGGRDKSVPPDSVRRLFGVLKDKGRPVLLIDRPEGGHATDYDDTTAAIRFVVEKVRGNSDQRAIARPVEDLDEAVAWLERESRRMIRACRREMDDGTAAFPPQVGIGYNAFWLRDYAYMLEGCIEGFEEKELRDACLMFVRAQREDGACVDCVKYDGTPIYKPGYGSMGENPVADGSQFTVDVAWHTYRRLGDRSLLGQIIDPLIKGMNAVPRNAESGLVHIRPDLDWDRCPYGFTDTVRKQGDVLFSSLLYVQAGRQLAELLEVLQRTDEARQWRSEADKVAASLREVFWDPQVGLFRAATVQCKEPDVWGSAFAVYLHVAEEGQAMAIARYFDEHYEQIVEKGQIRHLPGGVYWQEACPRDRYQNGAFWATATGWFVYALDRVDAKLADQTILDLVNDFQRRGCLEWCFGELAQRPDYLASGTMPLAGIRKVIERRVQRVSRQSRVDSTEPRKSGTAIGPPVVRGSGSVHNTSMRYHGTVVRPPSEARSYLLQVTLGCSHNGCTFCGTYLDKPFRARPVDEVLEDVALAGERLPDTRRVFLCDGNALVLSTDRLIGTLDALDSAFPRLQRVGIYANARDLLNKSDADLAALCEKKLTIVYLGLESGSDEVLRRINKGATAGEMVEAVHKAKRAGMRVSVIALLGIGGAELSSQHAEATGRVVSAMDPHYLSMLTLMFVPGTELYRQWQSGSFQALEPEELLAELGQVLVHLDGLSRCIFRTNHASNYLPLAGTLSRDQARLLDVLDQARSRGRSALRPEEWRAL